MDEKNMNFEEAVAELEKTVKAMEKGDLGLDDLLAGFERGIGLLRVCEKKLAEAEGRIEVLTKAQLEAAEPAAEEPAEDFDIFPGDAPPEADNYEDLF